MTHAGRSADADGSDCDSPDAQVVDLRTVLPAAATWVGALGGLAIGDGVAGTVLLPLVFACAVLLLVGAVLGVWLSGPAAMQPRSRPAEPRGLASGQPAGPWRDSGTGARPSGRGLTLGVALVCCVVGGVVGASRAAAAAGGPVPALAQARATVHVEAVVVADPTRREGISGREPYAVVRVRLDLVTGRGETVSVRTPVVLLASDLEWLGLLPGDRVAAWGRLAPSDRRGSEMALLRVDQPPERLDPGRPYAWVEPLREGLRDSVRGLPPDPRGLVPALVVGDEQQVPEDLRDDMHATGLTHLTAVSGANVAIVLGAVLGLARWGGMRSYALPAVGAVAVLVFVVVARPQPSVVRAAAMGLVALAALGAGGRRRGTATLGVAVLVLLLADPWLARSPGFALSVLATGGILVLAPAWRDAMPWLPRPMAAALSIPLAAQVACTPVLVVLSGDASVVSVPANLLAAPAVAPATILGAAAAVVTPVLPWAGPLLGWPAGVAAWWIVLVAEQGAQLPGATIGWPAGAWGAVAALGVAVLAVVLLPVVLRRRGLALAVVALLAVVLARPPLPGWPPHGWVAVLCQVGQGDAVVLRVDDGSAVVVDAGPDPEAVDGCLDRLGVTQVPAVLLSHFHADHVDGLSGVMDGRKVGEIVVSPLDDPPAQARRVRDLAAGTGVAVRVGEAGEVHRAGPVRWEVVWPRRLISGDGSAPNNASLVLLAAVDGVRLLLTGDVEPAAQRALLRSDADLGVDVLKVPHHGSAAQEPGFLLAAGARLALVGVGEDNTYGHPAESTLDLLTSTGARVLRTDVDGTVAVVVRRGELGVVTRSR